MTLHGFRMFEKFRGKFSLSALALSFPLNAPLRSSQKCPWTVVSSETFSKQLNVTSWRQAALCRVKGRIVCEVLESLCEYEPKGTI
jgi:hypothetical protein